MRSFFGHQKLQEFRPQLLFCGYTNDSLFISQKCQISPTFEERVYFTAPSTDMIT